MPEVLAACSAASAALVEYGFVTGRTLVEDERVLSQNGTRE